MRSFAPSLLEAIAGFRPTGTTVAAAARAAAVAQSLCGMAVAVAAGGGTARLAEVIRSCPLASWRPPLGGQPSMAIVVVTLLPPGVCVALALACHAAGTPPHAG